MASSQRDLTLHVIRFCRLLRMHNLGVTTAQAIDALRAVSEIDLADRTDFRLALRAIVTRSPTDLETFDRLFALFWAQASVGEDDEAGRLGAIPASPLDTQRWQVELELVDEPEDERKLELEEAFYSPLEVAEAKDFSGFQESDQGNLGKAILIIARKLAAAQSRRLRRARKPGRIDPRRSLRRSLKYGGTVVELAYRRRKISKPRLVLICDVSRSMDQYSRFVLQLIHGFQRLSGTVESFVFSTQLTRVTPYFRVGSLQEALDRMASEVVDWAGGTRIGQSLHAFNEQYAALLVDHRTTVLVLSDCLDSGDPELLSHAMALLRRRARKLIWLDPQLDESEYAFSSRSRDIVLPYLDLWAEVRDSDSLELLARHATL